MARTVAAIHRHPVKALGAEALGRAALAPGRTMPGDRVWALAHEGSAFDPRNPAWTRCTAFLRGATWPALMAVASTGAPGGPITFRHPSAAPVTVDPATPAGEAALLAWAAALLPPGAPRPVRLAAAPGRGMTDSPEATVSLLFDASLAALSGHAGRALDRRRFRGNFWIEGGRPWDEFELVGRRFRLGGALLEATDRIERCSATSADPETGRRDIDLPGLLQRVCGHRDFGIEAMVLEGGEVFLGDPLAPA